MRVQCNGPRYKSIGKKQTRHLVVSFYKKYATSTFKPVIYYLEDEHMGFTAYARMHGIPAKLLFPINRDPSIVKRFVKHGLKHAMCADMGSTPTAISADSIVWYDGMTNTTPVGLLHAVRNCRVFVTTLSSRGMTVHDRLVRTQREAKVLNCLGFTTNTAAQYTSDRGSPMDYIAYERLSTAAAPRVSASQLRAMAHTPWLRVPVSLWADRAAWEKKYVVLEHSSLLCQLDAPFGSDFSCSFLASMPNGSHRWVKDLWVPGMEEVKRWGISHVPINYLT